MRKKAYVLTGSETFGWTARENKTDKKQFSTVYSEQCQTSKMELFVKIVNGFQALAIFA